MDHNQRIRYGSDLRESYVQIITRTIIIKWLFQNEKLISFVILFGITNSLTKNNLKDNCIQKYFVYKIYMYVYFIYKIL